MNRSKRWTLKRALSTFLACAMVLSDLELPVMAAEQDDAVVTDVEAEVQEITVVAGEENYASAEVFGTVEGGDTGGEEGNDPVDDGTVLYEGHIDNDTDDGVYWKIDTDRKLTIKGAGEFKKGSSFPDWFQYANEIKTAYVDLSDTVDASYMFYCCGNLESVDLSKFDTSNVTDMSCMFYGCKNLVSLDLSSFDMGNVEKCSEMLNGCSSVQSIHTFKNLSRYIALPVSPMSDDAGKGYMSFPQNNAASISLQVSEPKLPIGDYVNDGAGKELTWNIDVNGNLTVSGNGEIKTRVTSYEGWTSYYPYWHSFVDQIKTAEIELEDVVDLSGMFSGCKNLTSVNLMKLNTEKVQNMSSMFRGCESLTKLDLSELKTSNVTNMASMFCGCSKLVDLNLSGFVTDNVTYMGEMFSGCICLTDLNLGSFDMKNATGLDSMFNGCTAMETIVTPKHLSQYVPLPVVPMEDKEKNVYLSFPQDQEEGISLQVTDNDLPVSEKVNNGTEEGITWSIDKDGNFTVEGSGDFTTYRNYNYYPYWSSYAGKIRTAKVKVTGATRAHAMFCDCTNLTSVDLSEFDTSQVTDMGYMFTACYSLVSVEFGEEFCTEKVTDMGSMFSSCYRLDKLDLSKFNTENVTNMSSMFSDCSGLISLDLSGFDAKNVTSMSCMFSGCNKLASLDLSGLDMGKVTDLYGMFSGCNAIQSITTPKNLNRYIALPVAPMCDADQKQYVSFPTNLSESITLSVSDLKLPMSEHVDTGVGDGIDWSINTDGKLMVKGSGSVKGNTSYPYWYSLAKEIKTAEISLTDITDVSYFFYQCENLVSVDLAGLDTSEVTDMGEMFGYCSSLTSLDFGNWSKFDTGKVTNMGQMFYGCGKLASLDLSSFHTNNVSGMRSMFSGCSSLTTLDLSGFDMGKVTNADSMFYGCSGMQSIVTFKNLNSYIELPVSPMLDTEGNSYISFPQNLKEGILLQVSEQKLPVEMHVNNGTAEGITWKIDREGNLVVSGTGDVKPRKATYTYETVYPYWHTFASEIKTATLKIKDMTDASYLFSDCTNLISVDLSEFDADSVTNMRRMFSSCSALASVDLSGVKTGNVTNMEGMFSHCYTLNSMDFSGIDTGNVTDMSSMFYCCSALKSVDFSGIDTGKVSNMNSMFWNCPSLTSVDMTGVDTSEVTSMSCMFYLCSSLENLDLSSFHTEKVTGMGYMFYGCNKLENLDLSSFHTEKVTSMYGMFSSCYALKNLEIGNFSAEKLTDASSMFSGCRNLTSIDLGNFRPENLTSASYMFDGCSMLTSLDLSGFDMRNISAENVSGMFSGCNALQTVNTFKNLRCYITLPVVPMGDANGQLYLSFPQNQETSIELTLSDKKVPVGERISNGADQDIEWKIDEDGKLTVSGKGEIKSRVSNSVYESIYPYWYSFASQIKSAEINLTGVTDISYLFYGCNSLVSVDLAGLDTSDVTNMGGMFYGCGSLKSVDVSKFVTDKTTNMNSMFRGCYSLIDLDISKFNTENVTNMEDMFYSDSRLTKLDLSGLDVRKVTSMRGIVGGCSSIQTLVTFRNLSLDVDLPRTMRDSEGWLQRTFPKGLEESVTLSTASELPIKEKVDNGTEDGIYWEIDADGKLVVRGSGAIKNQNATYSYYYSYPVWYDYAEKITSAELHLKDTEDISYMFQNCHNMKTVDFSDSDLGSVSNVTYMFSGCYSLENLDFSGFNPEKLSGLNSMFPYGSYGSLQKIKVFKNLNTKVKLPVTMKDTEGWHYKYFPMKLTESIELVRSDSESAVPAKGHVDNETNAGVDWTIDAEGKLTIKGTGSIKGDSAEYYYDDDEDGGNKKLPDWGDFCEDIKTAIVELEGAEDLSCMFAGCRKLESVDLRKLNTTGVTDMGYMFAGCESLTSLDISKLVTDSVTDMECMFKDCSALEQLDLSSVDTRNVNNMTGMFRNAESLAKLDVSMFDTGNVSNMSGMFRGCKKLTSLDLSSFNTENVTNMSSMFNGCSGLKSLDLSKFDTKNVTYMSSMFYNCSGLESLDLSKFDTGKVEVMYYMFRGCSSLKSLDLSNFNSSNVYDIERMFENCTSLVSLDVSGLDISYMEGLNDLFRGCTSIQTIRAFKNSDQYLALPKIPMRGDDGKLYVSFPRNEKGGMTLQVSDEKLPLTGHVNNGTEQGVSWSIDEDGLLIISGTGSFKFGEQDYPEWHVCAEYIKSAKVDLKDAYDLSNIFADCVNLSSVDLSELDTSDVRNMNGMFRGCSSLKSLDLSTLDTSNVQNMYSMFRGCSSLTSLNLGDIHTENVTDMRYMFSGCSRLTTLDVSKLITSNVRYMNNMFSDCGALSGLNVSNFDITQTYSLDGMFSGCSSLKSLDLSGFLGDNATCNNLVDGCTGLQTLKLFETRWRITLPHAMRGNDGVIYYEVPALYTRESVEDFTLQAVDWATMLPVSGKVENGTDQGIQWSIDKNGQLLLTGTGNLSEFHIEVSEEEDEVDYSGVEYLSDLLSEMYPYRGAVKTATVRLADITNTSDLFSGFMNLERVDLSGTDTSHVISMSSMFYNCGKLKDLKLGNMNTSNVRYMYNMFYNCSSLKQINLSSFDTGNVRDMEEMFYNCSGLTQLDVSGFDTGDVRYISRMFYNCSGLTQLDVSGFNTEKVRGFSEMFAGCSSLNSLDVSSFIIRDEAEVGYYDSEDDNDGTMFAGCTALKTLKTFPGLTGQWEGSLRMPISPMYDADGMVYTSFPRKLKEGIWLYADKSLIDVAFKTYTLYFDVNGGNSLEAASRQVKGAASYGELPVPVREGYTFAGWYTDAEAGKVVDADTVCVGDATIYAHWNLKEATGPDTPEPDTPEPDTPGPDTPGPDTPDAPNPSAEPKEYVVTFDVNGGIALEASTKKVLEGTAYGALPEATREGYTFAGWFTAAQGGDQVTAESICAGDITVYAHWTEIPKPQNDEGMKLRLKDETAVYTYTGSAVKPEIIVTYNGMELAEGVDYSVKYANNINANTNTYDTKAPTITIAGKGNLTGTMSIAFAIQKKNLADPDVMAEDVVTDNKDKAVPVICYNGMVLSNNTDFTFTKKAAETGTDATCVYVVEATNKNYTGTVSVNVFEKPKSELKKFTAKAVIPDKNALIFDGTEKKITVEVTGSDKVSLRENENYILVYGNNIDAGTALVTVIGKGDYVGTKTLKFTIKPASNALVKESNLAQSYPFNNEPVTIDDDLIVTDVDGKELTPGIDYRLTYSANTKVGKAKCKVSFLGNYKATKTRTVNFQITQGVLSDENTGLDIKVGNMAYTGKPGAYKSNVFVTVNGIALKKSDYTVTYYKDEARTLETKQKANYISLEDGEDETTVYVKITGKGNYASQNPNVYATTSYKVVRNENAIKLNKVKITILDGDGKKLKNAEYTGYALEPDIRVEYKNPATKQMELLDASQYEIQYQNNVDKGKATIVLAGNGTDTVGSKTATFKIVSKKIKR